MERRRALQFGRGPRVLSRNKRSSHRRGRLSPFPINLLQRRPPLHITRSVSRSHRTTPTTSPRLQRMVAINKWRQWPNTSLRPWQPRFDRHPLHPDINLLALSRRHRRLRCSSSTLLLEHRPRCHHLSTVPLVSMRRGHYPKYLHARLHRRELYLSGFVMCVWRDSVGTFVLDHACTFSWAFYCISFPSCPSACLPRYPDTRSIQ